MASMTTAAREAFLAQTRLGHLVMITEDAAPLSIPLWFDWDGERARMFTGSTSPKIPRLQRRPRVSLLVAAELGEKEAWVAIDGTVSILTEVGLNSPNVWRRNTGISTIRSELRQLNSGASRRVT